MHRLKYVAIGFVTGMILAGCSATDLGEIIQAAAQDPAAACFNVNYANMGSVVWARNNAPGEVTVEPGRCVIKRPAATVP